MLDEVMELLYELAKKDNEIAGIKRKMGDEPLKRKQFQVQLEETEKNFASVRDKRDENEKNNKLMEEEINTLKEKMRSDKQYLSTVKSNEEYMMILEGLKHKQDKINENENALLKNLTENEKYEEIMKKYEGDSSKANQLRGEIAKINENLKLYEQELLVKNDERMKIIRRLPDDLSKKYQRIFEKRRGVGIVIIETPHCQGCYAEIPAQLYDKVRSMKSVEFCLSCGRMLLHKKDEGSSKV
ncbi:MAG: zinc ribbon domain-containing protein [bacterium]